MQSMFHSPLESQDFGMQDQNLPLSESEPQSIEHDVHSAWERLQALWLSVDRAYLIHRMNYRDLQAYVESVMADDQLMRRILDMYDDTESEEFFCEVYRRLSNFCATAHSLVGVTRTLTRRLSDDEHFAVEFNRRLHEFVATYEFKFVTQLRNHLAHSGLPPIEIGLDLKDPARRFRPYTLHFVAEQAVEMIDMNQGLKEETRHRNHLDLLEIASQYTDLAHQLYEWLFSNYEAEGAR